MQHPTLELGILNYYLTKRSSAAAAQLQVCEDPLETGPLPGGQGQPL